MSYGLGFRQLAYIFASGLVLMACAQSSVDDGLVVEEAGEGYVVREGTTDVLFYQRLPKAHNGQFERSNYVHPLHGVNGAVLTEDFPDDHLHQRGIYWAWHQIYVGDTRIGDSWVMEDFSWDVNEVATLDRTGDRAGLEVHSNWLSPNWTDSTGQPKPFVEERAVIEVHPESDGVRLIDFRIDLRALEDTVRIGGSEDAKGYGGFSVRMRLPGDMRFTSREGRVTPRNLSIDAGPWIDISGPLGPEGQTGGIAILSHPSNPNHPQPWILREEASMQNPVYPGREPARLPTDEPLTLRYRLVVHDGGPAAVDLDALQEAYGRVE